MTATKSPKKDTTPKEKTPRGRKPKVDKPEDTKVLVEENGVKPDRGKRSVQPSESGSPTPPKKEKKKKVVEEKKEALYEVEEVVDKRDVGGVIEFLVKWRGWEEVTFIIILIIFIYILIIYILIICIIIIYIIICIIIIMMIQKTWEPRGNLDGSEKLIKKFEDGLGKKKKGHDGGVALCPVCNRIFLSQVT